jgi:hypothetical protein
MSLLRPLQCDDGPELLSSVWLAIDRIRLSGNNYYGLELIRDFPVTPTQCDTFMV